MNRLLFTVFLVACSLMVIYAAEVTNKTEAAKTTEKPIEATNTTKKPTEAKPESSTEASKQDTPKPESTEIGWAETSGVKHPEALVLLVAFFPLFVLFI
uniref:Uncharacterized protein n=1 Tax=Acrobeloides nanus TaxID=290746 RepID=A0A914DBN1_9BILA